MKILVCTTEYFPNGSGIANVAYNIVEQLKKRCIDCVICSPTGPDISLGSRKLILKFGRLGILYYWYKVSIYFSKNCDYDVVWLHQPLFILKNPFLKSISTIHVTTLGHFKARNKLNYSFFLKCYYFLFLIIEIYSLKKKSGITNFITDSTRVSHELIETIGNKVSPVFIPNGVNVERFTPLSDKTFVRKKFEIPICKKIFLTIGRLVPQKRLFLMVDIFTRVLEHDKNCFLIIAGKGELKSKLINHISSNDLKNINLIGFISEAELPYLYSCADYYIMTSDYEGQPLTLLEAMASGLPCIVSDIPSLKIVEDAGCGIVVDFSNRDEATRQILTYIKKYNYEHSSNAREYAIKYLDWNIITEKYIQEFKKHIN